MNYQVLARKWRPKNFQEMVGQEQILRILANALEQKRIHHAYLFTGTRGVGKTTLARIFAKCLNCDAGISKKACGECHICKAIDNGHFLDLYEVDAASRTKVEDTRELLDNVLYPPSQGRYKIYLIDEVHMLSNHSFNALLKTLEEPPEHVKFLLATTDPKRLPITVISRCLQFHLKPISADKITQHLNHICSVENIACEEKALQKLSTAANGSMRDALSLLDQAISYGQGSVNKQDIDGMLGTMSQEDLTPLLIALANQDAEELFKNIDLIAESSPDFNQVLEELINILHTIAIAQLLPVRNQLDENIISVANQFTPEEVQVYYQTALLGRRDLALTPTPLQGFEMTILRMLTFKPEIQPKIEKKIVELPKIKKTVPAEIKTNKSTDESLTEKIKWRELIPKLELNGMSYALASNCTLVSMEGNKIILAISANHQPMLNNKLQERIALALTRHFQKEIVLDIKVTNAEILTPHKQEQNENEQLLKNATEAAMRDPQIQNLIEMYDATVEVNLLS